MAYTPTNWTNEVPETTPVKYKIIDDVDGEIASSATIELVTPVEPGTPLNAQNLNHMEQGIYDAQETATQALADAAAAQGTANLARSEAAAANAAAANAAAAANTANTKADNALAAANARVPLFNSAVRTSEFSTSSTSWVDVLTVTLNMPSAGTILAMASGSHRAENYATGSEMRLLIDGGTSGAYATKSSQGDIDISWTGFALVERRAVSAGNRVIKLQQRQGGAASGTVYTQTANIIAIGFRS